MVFWNWEKMNLIPGNQAAWHQYQRGMSGNHVIFDASGNNRHLFGSDTAAPSLLPNQVNGEPAWYFNGSGTIEPLAFTSFFGFKHAFVVAAFERESFTDFEGLITGFEEAPLLLAQANSNRIFNLTEAAPAINYTYRKSDVGFANNNQIAPTGGKFAVMEMVFPGGYIMDGVQLGQDRQVSPLRPFKGWFAESLYYDRVLTAGERKRVYRYYALRYKIWRQKSDNLNIFPYCFDRTTQLAEADAAEISPAEGGRGRDTIYRYLNDEAIHSYNLQFAARPTIELESARQFCRQHRLHIPFWLEDGEKDAERKVHRSSEILIKSSGVSSHEYGFSVKDY